MATVFATGPTGVLGRATIPQLVANGHVVRALSRSDANDAVIRALQPVSVIAVDREGEIAVPTCLLGRSCPEEYEKWLERTGQL